MLHILLIYLRVRNPENPTSIINGSKRKESTMNNAALERGAFVTRVGLGVVLLTHSVYLKVFVFTLPGTVQFFASLGLPAVSAYAVIAIETAAGIALLAGYGVRFFSAAVVPVLLGATWAHSANGWVFTNSGGGWEYPLFLASIAVAQVFLGPGAFTVPNAVARIRRRVHGEAARSVHS
jgi:putative oxidoreductase